MPLLIGREQAVMAFEQVKALPEGEIEDYAQIIAKVVPMVMNCGLAQSLAFLAAKGQHKHQLVLSHLTRHLSIRPALGIDPACTGSDLVGTVVAADRQTYRMMTRLVLGSAGWLKRFASAREVVLEAGKMAKKEEKK